MLINTNTFVCAISECYSTRAKKIVIVISAPKIGTNMIILETNWPEIVPIING